MTLRPFLATEAPSSISKSPSHAPSPPPSRLNALHETPRVGRSYSLNEAREPDWPDGLKRYISDMKTGAGQSGERYDLVYVCSLVADVHYTMFEGGVAMNPR